MPTHEYICIECKNKFDVQLTFAEKESKPKPECPKCYGKKTIQFFGSFIVNSSSKNNTDYYSTSGCDPNAGTGCCQ